SGILDRTGLGYLSKLVARISLSCLLFVNTMKATKENDISGYLSVIFVTLLYFIILYFLGLFIAKICHLEGEKRNLFRAGTMFSNTGFMGVPIAEAVFGSVGVLMAALFTVVGDIILWTWGVNLTVPPEKLEKRSKKSIVKKIFSPCLVAVLLGFFMGLIGLSLPEKLHTAIKGIGSTASPLAMLYIGGIMCYVDLKKGLFKKEFIILIVLKMCILPILLARVLSFIPVIPREVGVYIALMAALPMMVTVSLVAESNGADSTYTAALAIVTTAVCIVTLPLVCLFM
nr:AEC family transporter [Sphaerochaetaceae bacterium]